MREHPETSGPCSRAAIARLVLAVGVIVMAVLVVPLSRADDRAGGDGSELLEDWRVCLEHIKRNDWDALARIDIKSFRERFWTPLASDTALASDPDYLYVCGAFVLRRVSTTVEIPEAEKESVELASVSLLERASGFDHWRAMAELARAWQEGLGVERDLRRASELFERSWRLCAAAHGPDHRLTLERLDGYAEFVFDIEADTARARPLYERLVDGLERSRRGIARIDLVEPSRRLARIERTLGNQERAVARMDRSIELEKSWLEDILARVERKDFEGLTDATAAALRRRGDFDTGRGRAREARALLEASLELERRLHSGDSSHVKTSLNLLALCLEDLGHPQRAEPLFREALALARRLSPAASRSVAVALNNLAGCLMSLGQESEALPLLRETLAIRQRLSRQADDEDVALGLNSLAYCLFGLGREDEALQLFDRVLAIRRRIFPGDHEYVVVTLNNAAAARVRLARFEDATPLCREALSMARRLYDTDHPVLGKTLGISAYCLDQIGRYAEALPLLRESLAMRRRILPEGHPSIAVALGNLAGCLDNLGRTSEAIPLFREAVDILRRRFTDGHPQLAAGLNNLALRLCHLDRPAEALPVYREALAMSERLYDGDHPMSATVLTGLSVCLDDLKRHDEALPLERRALEMRRRLYKGDHPDIAQSLHNLAANSLLRGEIDEALRLRILALEMAQRNRWQRAWMYATNVAWLHFDRGEYGQAAALLPAAVAQLESHRSDARGLTESDRGVYFRNLKRFGTHELALRAQLALGAPQDALDYLERGRGRTLLDILERDRDPLARALARARDEGDDETAAAIVALERDLAAAEREEARLTARKRQLLSDPGTEKTRTESDRVQRDLLASRARLETLHRERAVRIRGEVRLGAAAGHEELQGLLSGSERLLIYQLGDDESHVFVVPPAGNPIRAVKLEWRKDRPVTLDALRKSVGQYVASLGAEGRRASARRRPQTVAQGEDEQKGDRKKAETERSRIERLDRKGVLEGRALDALGLRLFRALFPEDVWKEVTEASRIYLVPHGPLHRLPFEALVVEPPRADDVVFLLDRAPPVATGSSGTLLLRSKERRDVQLRERRESRAVLLGDPVFQPEDAGPSGGLLVFERGALLERHGARLERLPGTRREIESIYQTLIGKPLDEEETPPRPAKPTAWQAVTLLGRNATEAKLLRAAAGARYLHLATHLVADETSGASYSSLALTPPSTPTADDDGFLKLTDLLERWHRKLERCELVVLSACETQLGREQLDEGIYALPWGFLMSGCPTVIASLWKVEDRSTAELMSEFYRRLHAAGEAGQIDRIDRVQSIDKVDAFTAARKALRARQPEPYFWAPFVYIGDPR